ncbi:MAG: hypothetical protein KC493_05570 [Bacteriovoracaceae bacterium]|nr:hypothetical protein [Bacteriovoracaceae bacterium]
MAKKSIIVLISGIIIIPIIVLGLYIVFSSTNSIEGLTNLLNKEKGNINEVFHINGDRLDISKLGKIQVTKVKDLKDYRRYLFFMPNSHYLTFSAAETNILKKSFPNSCKLIHSNQPYWAHSLAWYTDIFGFWAVFKCKKIEVKL